MNNKKKKKIKKVLSKYNYWRKALGLSFRLRRQRLAGSDCAASCQVACHSTPCEADPTCDFD